MRGTVYGRGGYDYGLNGDWQSPGGLELMERNLWQGQPPSAFAYSLYGIVRFATDHFRRIAYQGLIGLAAISDSLEHIAEAIETTTPHKGEPS